MVCDGPVLLVPLLFYFHHLLSCAFRGAQDTADPLLFGSCTIAFGIGDNILQRVRIKSFLDLQRLSVGCLSRVLGIHQNVSKVALDPP